jgi:hypothetical protein
MAEKTYWDQAAKRYIWFGNNRRKGRPHFLMLTNADLSMSLFTPQTPTSQQHQEKGLLRVMNEGRRHYLYGHFGLYSLM